jgi:hypothetical protein
MDMEILVDTDSITRRDCMKHIVLEQTKQALTSIINVLSLETLEENQRMISQYFDFLRTLNHLPNVAPVAEQTPTPKLDEPVAQVEDQAQLDDELCTFERKLRGGIIREIGEGYFIPERMVRDMGLEHGDKVRIRDTSKFGDLTRYHFELAEKANMSDPQGRIQFNYCVVESTATSFILRRHAGGDIMIDGYKDSLKLPIKDTQDFHLCEGDLIDVAFYENNVDSIRVLWKHEVEAIPAPSKRVAVKKIEEPKEEVDWETKFPINLGLLKGKTILIVGSMYEKAKYQRGFEAIGINLIHLTGDETKVRMRSQIKKSDIVVVTTQQVGHNGSVPAAELAKEYDKAFAQVDRNGVQYILIEAERVYKRKIEQQVTA